MATGPPSGGVVIVSLVDRPSTPRQRWDARREWLPRFQSLGEPRVVLDAAMADPLLFEELVQLMMAHSAAPQHSATHCPSAAALLHEEPAQHTSPTVPASRARRRRAPAPSTSRPSSHAPSARSRRTKARRTQPPVAALSQHTDPASAPTAAPAHARLAVWPYTGTHISHGHAVHARMTVTAEEFDMVTHHDPPFARLHSHWHSFSYLARAFDRWIATGVLETDTEDEGYDFDFTFDWGRDDAMSDDNW